MKIVFLHGLTSVTNCDKVKWLREEGHEVLNPKMIYASKYMYKNVLAEIKKFKPDVIIGSSMGGYFAYEICRELNITGLLLNPALHSRSMIKKLPYGNEYGSIDVFLGSEDKVIDPYKTITKLQERKKEFNLTLGTYSHRTPLTVFKDIYKKTVIDAIK